MSRNLLQKAARYLDVKLGNQTAVSVTIRNADLALDNIDAIPGRSDFEQYAADEYSGTSKTFDWIVSEQDLLFDGEKLEPQPKWEIWYKLPDGRTAIYIVVAQPGSRCFDVVDQLGLMYRIHTKLDRIDAIDTPEAE